MLYRVHLAVNGVRTLGADCTGSYKTNYHTITVTTVPNQLNLGVILQYLITTIFNQTGADSGGGTHPVRAPPPLKLEKNMIFWRKIVIFHTKYPKNVRASLRNWKKYDFLA